MTMTALVAACCFAQEPVVIRGAQSIEVGSYKVVLNGPTDLAVSGDTISILGAGQQPPNGGGTSTIEKEFHDAAKAKAQDAIAKSSDPDGLKPVLVNLAHYAFAVDWDSVADVQEGLVLTTDSIRRIAAGFLSEIDPILKEVQRLRTEKALSKKTELRQAWRGVASALTEASKE